MPSPLLAIAQGVLSGALSNRDKAEQRARDELAQQQAADQMLIKSGWRLRPKAAPEAPVADAGDLGGVTGMTGALARAQQAITQLQQPADEDVSQFGMAPDDDAPAPTAPRMSAAPVHAAALSALSSLGATKEPPAAPRLPARALHTPGLDGFELEDPAEQETKQEQAARLKEEMGTRERTRKIANWKQKGFDDATAEILADKPELYKEFTTQKPETKEAMFDRLTKGEKMSPDAANRMVRLRFGENLRDPNAAKEPKWQVQQTDQGLVQVNPETGEVRPVTTSSGQQLQKPVPAAIAKGVVNNRRQLETIDDAIAKVTAHPTAVGLRRMVMPDAVSQRTDTAGVEARAAVADIGSLILHDRSGAAVTAAEFPRLRAFVPSTHDDAKTVIRKLGRMRQLLADENAAMVELFPALGASATQPSGAGRTAPAAARYSPDNPYAPKP